MGKLVPEHKSLVMLRCAKLMVASGISTVCEQYRDIKHCVCCVYVCVFFMLQHLKSLVHFDIKHHNAVNMFRLHKVLNLATWNLPRATGTQAFAILVNNQTGPVQLRKHVCSSAMQTRTASERKCVVQGLMTDHLCARTSRWVTPLQGCMLL